MSKNLTLDTRNIYQIGLILIGIISLVIILLTVLKSLELFKQPEISPALTIRQQQLENAVKLTFPK